MSKWRADRRDYHQEYYQRHRFELSERRKRAYREDPAVRGKVLRSSKAYRERLREEKDRLREEGLLPPLGKRGPRRPVGVDLCGEIVSGYTVAVLASRVGRSVSTINNWIRIGTLPVTPYRSNRGDRLYTEGMILAVKIAVQSRGVVGVDADMCDEIRREWSNMGVLFKEER